MTSDMAAQSHGDLLASLYRLCQIFGLVLDVDGVLNCAIGDVTIPVDRGMQPGKERR
jgi:hypothetical protein